MQKAYESLKFFYLGGDKNKAPYLYQSKDLTTHGLIIGMTGSGKTGLGISLIEEATIDNIPSIIIDPKGDMGNLLLAFPNLSIDEFKPWIDIDEARSKNKSIDELAEDTARLWQNGLRDWDEEKERIARFKDSADFTIYTPGATNGISVSILNSFNAPSVEIVEDSDFFNQLISSTVTGILGFVGINADPLSSKEHILLSTIFTLQYKDGKDLSMEDLISFIINPSFDKIGVFALEKFFPQDKRVELAMKINSIIASPSFAAWCQGDSLNISKLLYTKEGKARVSIFSISHLNDNERMFFVTLLLNAVIGWMRGLDGTSSLRAVVYMDEIFGFFPPNANPPSKIPMLTLLKQARAFGVGVVLSTQNPVDLDYKGLSNIGTWFIGRLQTTQDKERVIDGLSGISGSEYSKSDLMNLLSNLDKRNFLVKNIHEDGLKVIQTRWALSYLKGPLSREQIKFLMQDKKNQKQSLHARSQEKNEIKNVQVSHKPLITSNIEQFYFYESMSETPRLEPYIYASAKVRIISTKKSVDKEINVNIFSLATKDKNSISWVQDNDFEIKRISKEKREKAQFDEVATFVNEPKEFVKFKTSVEDFIYRNVKIINYSAPDLKLISNEDESIEAFRGRMQIKLNELLDMQSKKLKEDFEKKSKILEQKLIKANVKLEKEKSDVQAKTLDTAISFGSTFLGALFGKGVTSISKATNGVKNANKVLKEKQDVTNVQNEIASINTEIKTLEDKFRIDANILGEKYDMKNFEVKEEAILPRRSDIYDIKLSILWKEV